MAASQSTKWEPGRTHWYATTAIAVIGALVAGVSLVMQFFYHPAPPPTTMESEHEAFMKLSYGDRIDICQPYIAEHAVEFYDSWAEQAGKTANHRRLVTGGTTKVDASRASGQQIENYYMSVLNFAEKNAPANVGMNLLSCLVAPPVAGIPSSEQGDVKTAVGNGNRQPYLWRPVVHESPIFIEGSFAGVEAAGRRTKLLEVEIQSVPTKHVQIALSIVSGRNYQMWARVARINEGDPAWVNDVEHFLSP